MREEYDEGMIGNKFGRVEINHGPNSEQEQQISKVVAAFNYNYHQLKRKHESRFQKLIYENYLQTYKQLLFEMLVVSA